MTKTYRGKNTAMAVNSPRYVMPLAFLLAILSIWGLVGATGVVPSYLIPPPFEVFEVFRTDWQLLLFHMLITGAEAGIGFLLGCGMGAAMGVAFGEISWLRLAAYPYAIGLKTVPIIALAPLLTIWFGNGISAKVIMASLICFFPAVVNSLRGYEEVPREAIDLFRSLGASRWEQLIKLRLPYSVPFVFSALRISATLSVIGAIVGELTGSNRGIGYWILVSSYRLRADDLFAGIILAGALGLALFGLVIAAERLVIPWADVRDT